MLDRHGTGHDLITQAALDRIGRVKLDLIETLQSVSVFQRYRSDMAWGTLVVLAVLAAGATQSWFAVALGWIAIGAAWPNLLSHVASRRVGKHWRADEYVLFETGEVHQLRRRRSTFYSARGIERKTWRVHSAEIQMLDALSCINRRYLGAPGFAAVTALEEDSKRVGIHCR